MKDNILLIGFMGVGKGRTARSLAELTGMFALDCDDLIESYANKRIRQIFAEDGEPAFRELEHRVAKWLEKSIRGAVISTGGGFVNVANLKSIGTVVYLHADFDSIIAGIRSHPNAEKKIRKRPLLQDLDGARKLHEARLPVYRRVADVEVFIAERPIARVAEEIVERIKALHRGKS